jgi:hypothetical protein
VQATGVITLLALLLDRRGAESWLARCRNQIVSDWRPARDLAPLPHPQPPPPPPPLARSLTGYLIGVGVLVVWISGAADDMLKSLLAITHVQPTAIVLALRWPMLLIAVALTVLHVMTGLKRLPARALAALSLPIRISVLAILLVLLAHWPWLAVVDLPPASGASLTRGLNIGLGIGLGIPWGVLALMTVGFLLRDLTQLRPRRA